MPMCRYVHMHAVLLNPEEGTGCPEPGCRDPFSVDAGNETESFASTCS